jgi:hypothetical protein
MNYFAQSSASLLEIGGILGEMQVKAYHPPLAAGAFGKTGRT